MTSTPKYGTINVGHASVHSGNGYKGATLDDYPVKFGLRDTPAPESSKAPKRRRMYGKGK